MAQLLIGNTQSRPSDCTAAGRLPTPRAPNGVRAPVLQSMRNGLAGGSRANGIQEVTRGSSKTVPNLTLTKRLSAIFAVYTPGQSPLTDHLRDAITITARGQTGPTAKARFRCKIGL